MNLTPKQIAKRAQNVRYREKRKALMAAGAHVLNEETKPSVPKPQGPTKDQYWTEERRKAQGERMKKAHALKPDWKREERLRRYGYLPPKDAAPPAEEPLVIYAGGNDPAMPLRADGKPYIRGPYKKKAAAQVGTPRPSKRLTGVLGILVDNIRTELLEHIRAGHDLTPFHTNVLALTDFLRKQNDGDDGV